MDPNGPLPKLPTNYFRAGLRFGWNYSDLYSSPMAISKEKGRTLYLSMSVYNPVFGGNQELVRFSWGWKEYLLAPWLKHHVFALNLRGEVYVSNPMRQAGFSAGGYDEQDVLSSLMDETFMGLPKIRGYAPSSIHGDHYHSLRLEYRLPLWRPETSYGTLPAFFRRLHGAVFTDNLLMSYENLEFDDLRTSVGAELVWSFFWGYHMPITLRTGYARGLMDDGVNEFIFVLGGTY